MSWGGKKRIAWEKKKKTRAKLTVRQAIWGQVDRNGLRKLKEFTVEREEARIINKSLSKCKAMTTAFWLCGKHGCVGYNRGGVGRHTWPRFASDKDDQVAFHCPLIWSSLRTEGRKCITAEKVVPSRKASGSKQAAGSTATEGIWLNIFSHIVLQALCIYSLELKEIHAIVTSLLWGKWNRYFYMWAVSYLGPTQQW